MQQTILKISQKVSNTNELVNTVSLLKTTLTKPQLFVDISAIVKFDAKTGISRVVKSQLNELIKLKQDKYEIKPVYLKSYKNQTSYYFANNYTNKTIDKPVLFSQNDILYIPDLSSKDIKEAKESNYFDYLNNIGLKIIFLVYDLLPVLYPHFFRENQDIIHTRWLNDITSITSDFFAISNAVAKDLSNWIKTNKPTLKPNIKVIHLGANLPNSIISPPQIQKKSTIDFLIVSTIEPRKAHAQTLHAFELLWQTNPNINLHIVGKKGWLVDDFMTYLQNHPQLNKKLFYHSFIDDEALNNLYAKSDAVIIPSYDEGFGLPIIEAAFYQKPIILRDIEVFKEVATNNAYYFKDTKDPKDLTQAIAKWIDLYKQNIHPKSNNLKFLSWEENAKITFDYLICKGSL